MENLTNTTANSTILEEVSYTVEYGDVSWVMVSTALVMLMTPGLAFFYGGLVKKVNILNTMMMSYASIGIVTIQWVVFGYTLSFGRGNPFIGDFTYGGLKGLDGSIEPLYSTTIPHSLFCLFQLMFAIVTGAILSGGVAERMKFITYLIFLALWTTLVYDPVAHWAWSAYPVQENGETKVAYGWLHTLGAIDFAGGTVVHITSGFSAMVASAIVGPRQELVTHAPNAKVPHKKPHNIPYVLLGGGLIWFGWFGFNAGSALSSGSLAVLAFVNTQIAASIGMMTWIVLDLLVHKHASAEGAISGAVVGLVGITPCAGFVHLQSSLAIGSISSMVVYGSVVVKAKFFPRYFPQLDDSLDCFTCHGIGAVSGAILLGFFSSTSVNPAGANGVLFGNPILLAYQLAAVASVVAWSAVVTALILIPLKYTIGLTASSEKQMIGLDKVYHGGSAHPEDEEEMVAISSNNEKSENDSNYNLLEQHQ